MKGVREGVGQFKKKILLIFLKIQRIGEKMMFGGRGGGVKKVVWKQISSYFSSSSDNLREKMFLKKKKWRGGGDATLIFSSYFNLLGQNKDTPQIFPPNFPRFPGGGLKVFVVGWWSGWVVWAVTKILLFLIFLQHGSSLLQYTLLFIPSGELLISCKGDPFTDFEKTAQT